MKKRIEPKCGNCQLYDPLKGVCKVVILAGSLPKQVLKEITGTELHNGRINLPVSPNDSCFFENKFEAKGEDGTKDVFTATDSLKEVKFWVENPDTGERTTGNGRVMMEYPEEFFGNESTG